MKIDNNPAARHDNIIGAPSKTVLFKGIEAMSVQHETIRLIRVFVSSPGDVTQERDVLDEAIGFVNDGIGRQRRIRLETWKWEDKVVPRIGSTPQSVVDDQSPHYDIYLGIMSSRFGTPTDKYGSGTEREFREALERWGEQGEPWILFYFRDNLVLSSDPDDAGEYLKVCRFRKELQSLGIIKGYACVRGEKTSFYDQVLKHLQQLIFQFTEEPQPTSKLFKRTDSTTPSISRSYHHWIQKQCADIDLLGLQLKQGQSVRLNHVYVPLTTTTKEEQAAAPTSRLKQMALELDEKPPLLLDALDKQSLYVSGAPGSGKSTFSRWVAWLTCSGTLPPQGIESPEGYREQYPESFQNRLSLLVRLRDFWMSLPETPGGQDLSQPELEAVLEKWIETKKPGDLQWANVQAHLEIGSLLLVLDGVDEVPLTRGKEDQACYPRAMLLSGLAAARQAWVERGNRLLVTSRPYGLTELGIRTLGLMHAPISDMAESLQWLLVRRWFRILADDIATGTDTAEELLAELNARGKLGPLVANPMLLTAICIIYSQGKRLPQDKYELYDRIVDNVLYNRYRDPALIDLERSRLSVIAYGMHTGVNVGDQRTTPQAEVTDAEIDRILQAYKEQSAWTEQGYKGVVDTREQLLSRSGILLPQGERHAGFYHFTFQDFLAAQWLQDAEGERLLTVFRERAPVDEWHNTLSFVFSALLARSTSPDRSIKLLSQLIEDIDDQSLGLALVVAECLTILMGRKYRLEVKIEARFRDICLDAIEHEVLVRPRCALGLALGRLGDPRIVTDLRDRSGYVEIAAGDYAFGEERQPFRREKPLWLSRYLVTNQQYALFMEEGGYRSRRWWPEVGWEWLQQTEIHEPLYWHHAKWNGANQPVVGVSFWEAMAVAAWAGARVPTERQWEAAARGPNGFEYPWGDEWEDGICNTWESGAGVTSAVGLFPRSRASIGLEDMAGNVWEWCLNKYDNPGDTTDRGDVARVLRGGSWDNGLVDARASYRYGFNPHLRLNRVGFRLCRASPISSWYRR